MAVNILVARNRKSGNLEIGVPVLGNRLFVLDYLSISMGILVKALPHLRCVAAFTNILIEIMIRYAQKVNLKSDFHIAEHPMESHPEYSLYISFFRLCTQFPVAPEL